MRLNLKHTDESNIQVIVNLIKEVEYYEDSASQIETLIHKNDIISYKKYRALLYNVSGARVVNCENSLDQENMLYDYSVADIENRKTILSNIQIFHKILVEQIFEYHESVGFPLSFLDKLSFEDILKIREVLGQREFVLKYNELIESSSKIINSDEYVDFYRIEQLFKISEDLYNNFFSQIEKEVKHYVKTNNRDFYEEGIVIPFVNILKSISTRLNPIHSTTNFISELSQNTLHLVRNLLGYIKNQKNLNSRKVYLKSYSDLTKKIIENSEISQKTTFHDFIRLLNDIYQNKYGKF